MAGETHFGINYPLIDTGSPLYPGSMADNITSNSGVSTIELHFPFDATRVGVFLTSTSNLTGEVSNSTVYSFRVIDSDVDTWIGYMLRRDIELPGEYTITVQADDYQHSDWEYFSYAELTVQSFSDTFSWKVDSLRPVLQTNSIHFTELYGLSEFALDGTVLASPGDLIVVRLKGPGDTEWTSYSSEPGQGISTQYISTLGDLSPGTIDFYAWRLGGIEKITDAPESAASTSSAIHETTGTYQAEIYAIDAAGNQSMETRSFTVTHETNKPEVKIGGKRASDGENLHLSIPMYGTINLRADEKVLWSVLGDESDNFAILDLFTRHRDGSVDATEYVSANTLTYDGYLSLTQPQHVTLRAEDMSGNVTVVGVDITRSWYSHTGHWVPVDFF